MVYGQTRSPGRPKLPAAPGSLCQKTFLGEEGKTSRTALKISPFFEGACPYKRSFTSGSKGSTWEMASKKTGKRPKLRLIQGSYPLTVSVGSVDIVAAPKHRPPFPVDAVVFEEDTFLVLSADPEVGNPHEHQVQLMTRLIETRPEQPGTVLVKGRRPLRLLAIVHDLNCDPSWKEEWIASSLNGIFREAERRKLQSIALPFLGTLHGRLEKDRFLVLLRGFLERGSTKHPRRVWLVVPAGTSSRIFEVLEYSLQK